MPKSSPHDNINLEETWRSVCKLLKDQLPLQSYFTWFNPLEPISLQDDTLTIRIPSRFYSDWIEGHYGKQLKDSINQIYGDDVQLTYEVDHNSGKAKKEEEKIPVSSDVNKLTKKKKKNKFNTNLNLHYSFDNFIEGDCNRFARAAAIAIAEKPGETPFNPHIIYGKSGIGKTHLIQAIGNAILENYPDLKVLYVTSERFTNDFVRAIKSGQNESFSSIYRSTDVLLLDDVQFFMSKEKTQEEFFHTFNALHQMGKQLVFSSDRSPKDLDKFDERLISRLQWGLVSELHVPDIETRTAILNDQAKVLKTPVPEEIIQFLAMNVTDNVRTLQGALVQIEAQSSLIGTPLTLDLARKVLSEIINRPRKKISIEKIQEVVAVEFDIPSDLIRSKTRKKHIAEARQIAMYLCTIYTESTLKNIGMLFGGRDHTTIIHARERVNESIKDDKNTAEVVEKLKKKLDLSSI